MDQYRERLEALPRRYEPTIGEVISNGASASDVAIVGGATGAGYLYGRLAG